MSNRPGLIEVMSRARCARGKALIIVDLDNLCLREQEAALLMLDFQDFRSVEVWDSSTRTELTSQQERWERVLMAADATTLLETKRAFNDVKKNATRLSNGTRVGRRSFGELPDEQQILAMIWKLRRKRRDGTGRRSYQSIAETLNLKGVKPRQGKKWYAKTVQGIVMRTKPHLDKD